MAHEVTAEPKGDAGAFEVACSCGFLAHVSGPEAASAVSFAHRTQGFFAQLAAEARRPSYGEMQAGWTRSMLLRAQEAGLFKPEDA